MKERFKYIIFVLLIGPFSIINVDGQSSKAKLTSDNYLVEMDLHQSYLSSELDDLKESKSKLMTKMKSSDKKTELQMKELSAKEKSLSSELAVLGSKRVSRDLPQPPSPRPCPVPRNCMPLPPGSNFLIVDNDVRSLTLNIYSDKGKLLATGSGKPNLVPGVKGKSVKAIAFQLKAFKGPVEIKVKKVDMLSKTSTYTVQGYIQ